MKDKEDLKINLKSNSKISVTLNASQIKNEKNSLDTETKKKELENLINLFNQNKFDDLYKQAVIFNNKYPDNLEGLNALALSYKHIKEYNKAIEVFYKTIKIFPDIDFVYGNLGNLFFELGDHKKAKELQEKTLEINPNNIGAMNGIGLIISNAGDDNGAIEFYKRALKVNPNDSNTHFNIATSYRKVEQFGKAAEHFMQTKDIKAEDNLLECLYLEAENPKSETTIDDFFSLLDKAKDSERLWPSSAALSAHASVRFKKPDVYPFCKDPDQFVQKYNLIDESKLTDKKINEFLADVFNSNLSKRGQSLLQNGEQTSGNLFLLENPSIQYFKKIVEDKIAQYRQFYRNKDIGFINRWPSKYIIYGWVIIMNDNGSLRSHIHKEGWLSSSIYLKMPEKMTDNQGDIVFSKHGANYPKEKNIVFSEEIVPLKIGDMVMFPSSYFHSTIPFSSKHQRIVLAIDVIPK